MKKRVLVLMLGMFLVVGLSACGDNSEKKDISSENVKSSSSEKNSDSEEMQNDSSSEDDIKNTEDTSDLDSSEQDKEPETGNFESLQADEEFEIEVGDGQVSSGA